MLKDEKKIGKNYGFNLIYEIFMLIVPILIMPYVSRVLGEDCSGQYSFTFSIVTYFSRVAALGFDRYAQRLIASHQGNKHKQSVDFYEVLLLRGISVLITTVIYLCVIFTGVYGEKYTLLMYILVINVVAVGFDITFLFKGNEDFGKIVIKNIVVKGLGFASIFVFVKSEEDLWVYTLIQSLIVILSFMSMWSGLKRSLEKVEFKEIRILQHLKPAFLLFIPSIAASIYVALDKTLIGLITQNDAENGNYEYAEKLVKMGVVALTSLGMVMLPRNSQKFASGDIEGVKENIYASCKFVFFLGIPLVFGFIAVADNFIPWYLGDGYSKAPGIMKILAPLIVIIGLSDVFGLQYLVPSGDDKRFTIAIVCGAIVNFTWNCLLIPTLKSYGAAIATIIAEGIVTFVMAMFARKDIKMSKVILSSLKYLLSGAVMFICCFFAGYYLEPSVLSTLIQVVVGVFVYGAMMLVVKDDFVSPVMRKICKKIKNK